MSHRETETATECKQMGIEKYANKVFQMLKRSNFDRLPHYDYMYMCIFNNVIQAAVKFTTIFTLECRFKFK